MSGTQVNLFSVGDVDLTSMMDTLDRQRITFHALSLTNYDNTALPAIAAGSHEEVAGTLFKFTVEEAITGWAGVAVGVAYIKLVPAGTDPDTVTAEFTDTAPTWSDAKQGWYGTAAAANHKYVATLYKVDAATYQAKNIYRGRYGEKPMQSRMRITKDNIQVIPNGATTIIEYDDVDYDNLGEYDNVTNYRFTAFATGYYEIMAGYTMSSAGAWPAEKYFQLSIFKNGAEVSIGTRDTSDVNLSTTKSSNIADVIYLESTDYVDIRAYHNRGANTESLPSKQAYFTVHRLS